MSQSEIILTDSGGIQEEAPSLNKPILVMRDKTERPEVVQVGAARIVGSDPKNIVNTACMLLDDKNIYLQMIGKINPFGDGDAGEKISLIVESQL